MLRKFTNRKGFTLVELMIVVAIIGILAAIAIPAFLRSVKKSKTAESEQTMKKIADGAKTYFMTEQKVEPAQPWHPVTATSPNGYPVPWAGYQFPGGQTEYQTVLDANIPTGGSKVAPLVCATAMCTATLNKLGIDFRDPLYFQYTYTPLGLGQAASVSITAIANFKVGGTSHTVRQDVNVDDSSQEVQVTPPFTTNEFE